MKVFLISALIATTVFSQSFEEFKQQQYRDFDSFRFSKKESPDKKSVECEITTSTSNTEEKEIPRSNNQKKDFFSSIADSISKKSGDLGFETDEIQFEAGLILPVVTVVLKLKSDHANYAKVLSSTDSLYEKMVIKMMVDAHKKVVSHNKTASWKVDMVYLFVSVPPSVKWNYKKS